MLKISFSGFNGSGKTTLLTEVKKILGLKYKVEYCDELMGKNPFDDAQRFDFISLFYLFSMQVNEENIKEMSRADFLLCDQSVLDYWIHWQSFFKDREKTPLLLEKNAILENLYRFWIRSYDLLFWIRMDLKTMSQREIADELRIIDVDGIKRYEDILKETVQDSHLKLIEIWNNKSVDESAHTIIRHIYDYKDRESSEYHKIA